MNAVLYRDPAELARCHPGSGAWAQTAAVLAAARPEDPPHARSAGDSLTYWVDTAAALATEHFAAHRLYRTVLCAFEADVRVDLVAASQLLTIRPYSDTDDIEWLDRPTGAGAAEPTHRGLALPAGGVLAIDPRTAWRLAPGPARLCLARVTDLAGPACGGIEVAP
jgi:hypothetical protein